MSVRRVADDAETYQASMLARLRASSLGLNTEAGDDFAVALVGAWAAVVANLGFYQNYLAGEAYLDSADEPRSVRELVHLTGYEPRPAVTAETVLAFTARSHDGAPDTTIVAGRKVQSVPAEGETQVTFETSQDLAVRPAWSRLVAAVAEPGSIIITALTRWLVVETSRPAPRVGDGVLVRTRPGKHARSGEPMFFRTIERVERSARGASFRLLLAHDDPTRFDHVADAVPGELADPEILLLSTRTSPFGADAPLWAAADLRDREPVGTRRGWVMESDLGRKWRRRDDGLPTLDVYCLAMDPGGNAFAGTAGAGVYRLAASAGTWVPFGEGAEKAKVTALATTTDGRVFAGTEDETVLRYSPDTGTWDPLGDRVQHSRNGRRRGPNRAPWPRSPVRSLVPATVFKKRLLFAGTDAGVYRWADDKRTWRGLNAGLPEWDLDTARTRAPALAFDEQRFELYAATSQGVYRSQTLGYSWHRRNAELGSMSSDGRPPRATDLFLTRWDDPKRLTLFAATETGVFHSDNGGRHWQAIADVDSRFGSVARITLSGDRRLFAGTDYGVLGWGAGESEWSLFPAAPTPDDDAALLTDPMRDVWSLVGHPNGRVLAAMPRGDFLDREWPDFWIGAPGCPFIDLPTPKRVVTAGSAIVLRNRTTRDLLVSTIVRTSELDRHAFGLKRAVLRCELRLDDPTSLRSRFPIRETDVFIGSSELVALADRSDRVEPVRGDRVLLAATTDLPPAGRLVTVSGRRVRARLTRLGGVVRHASSAPVHDGLTWLDVSAVAVRADGVAFVIVDDIGLVTRDATGRWGHAAIGLPSADVCALAATYDGDLLAVAASGELWSADPWATRWSSATVHLPHAGRWSLAVVPDGGLLAATPSEVWQLRRGETSWVHLPIDFPGGPIDALAVTRDGSLHLATSDSVIHRFDAITRQWSSDDSLVHTEVTSLAAGPGGELIVGTRAVLRLRSDEATMGEALRPEPLGDVDPRHGVGLERGIVPDELRRAIAGRVAGLGDLRVTWSSAVTTYLTDTSTFERYVVVHGVSRMSLYQLPASLRVEGDPVVRVDGRIEWTLRSRAGSRSGSVVLPAGAVEFVGADPTDAKCCEVARVAGWAGPDSRGRPELVLAHALDHAYDPTTVELNANSVEATAGASVPYEVLGSGDALLANQSFRLSHPHLVYTVGVGGFTSSLIVEVGVSGPAQAMRSADATGERVTWGEVPSLLEAGPGNRVFELHHDEDGRATVRFGDGVHGARLPTGYANVVARYRTGETAPVQVRAGQVTLLVSRPRGILAVTNPVDAMGAQPAETSAEQRWGAPRATRVPRRVVTMADIERFAAAFPGVGHASASLLDASGRTVVHLSVATSDGTAIGHESPLVADLAESLRSAWARPIDLEIEPARWAFVTIDAALAVEPHHDPVDVERVASDLLSLAYRPADARFGAGIAAARVIARLEEIPGVLGVDLRTFTSSADRRGRETFVGAPLAKWDSATRRFLPATLVAIGSIDIAATRAPR